MRDRTVVWVKKNFVWKSFGLNQRKIFSISKKLREWNNKFMLVSEIDCFQQSHPMKHPNDLETVISFFTFSFWNLVFAFCERFDDLRKKTIFLDKFIVQVFWFQNRKRQPNRLVKSSLLIFVCRFFFSCLGRHMIVITVIQLVNLKVLNRRIEVK